MHINAKILNGMKKHFTVVVSQIPKASLLPFKSI